MTSPDLGSAFTACPDDTPKRLQVWFSAPITCACPIVAENVALAINAISKASGSDMRIVVWLKDSLIMADTDWASRRTSLLGAFFRRLRGASKDLNSILNGTR